MFKDNDIYEGYTEDTEGEGELETNFGSSIPLSEYMEGVTNGFDIRHFEQQTTPDKSHGGCIVDLDKDYTDITYEDDPRHAGVPEVLRGFGENESPEMNIYVQEIIDLLGPGQGEGGGPFEIETNFLLDDYIMFRTCSFAPPFIGRDGKWKKSQRIDFNYDPLNAVLAAEELFSQLEDRFYTDKQTVANRALKILQATEEKGLDKSIYYAYLNWAKRNIGVDLNEEMEGFKFHFDPVTEDETTVNSRELPGHMAADLSYIEAEEARIKEESRDDVYFQENGELSLCGEEFKYIVQKKEERERRTKGILDWISRNNKEKVAQVFKTGKFKKILQKSRSECLRPTGRFRTLFKSPYELWLTKAQADTITKAAVEKMNG